MKHIFLFILLGVISSVSAEERGIIGKVIEQGKPVIYSLDNYLPETSIIEDFPTLVVLKWEYDGSKNNGMPTESEQELIFKLEDALNDIADDNGSFRAYARTGNNLREFVYYTIDQASFLHLFNQAVAYHPRYPIEITFYQDPDWSDYKKLMADFKKDS